MANDGIGFASKLSAGADAPEWYDSPQSSWVSRFRYFHPDDYPDLLSFPLGVLQIQFKNKQGNPTVICEYDGLTPSYFQRLHDAASKGKTVHAIIVGYPYKIVG
jgi:hypothetical protein